MGATLLALDTSNQYCSTALQVGGRIYARHEWSEQKHSAMLLPIIRMLFDEADCSLSQLDAIAVGIGPGGFTGVRLAVAVAQGLALALAKPIIPCASLEALAIAAVNAQLDQPQSQALSVLVAMDARMQQVYWAQYRWEAGALQTVHAPDLEDVAVFCTRMQGVSKSVVCVGNALSSFEGVAQTAEQARLTWVALEQCAPRASDLLVSAQHQWAAGHACDPHLVQPLYVRDKVAQTVAERMQSGA